MPEPATRSVTVRDTSTSPGSAFDLDTLSDVDANASDVITNGLDLTGVKPGADLQSPAFRIPSRMAHPHRMARAGPSNVARKPSPVVFTSLPLKRSSSRRVMFMVSLERLPPLLITQLYGALAWIRRCL